MITITSNIDYISMMIGMPNTRVVVVSEDAPAYIKAGAVSLPIILPPSEVLCELMSDIESGHYSYEQSIGAFVCQYQDYLMSNLELLQIIHMIGLSAANNNIIIYISESDMYNTDFPFFNPMLAFLTNEWLSQAVQTDKFTFAIDLSPYAVLNSALYLYKTGVIGLDVVFSIIDNPKTMLPPEIACDLLLAAYGNQILPPAMQIYISKKLFKDTLLGKQIVKQKKPAFYWGV